MSEETTRALAIAVLLVTVTVAFIVTREREFIGAFVVLVPAFVDSASYAIRKRGGRRGT